MPFVVEKKPKDPSITTETSVTLSHLSRSVLNALVNFIPAGKYLRQNVLTPLGVRMEGECILNHNCVPLPLAQFDQGQPLPDRSARFVIISILNLTNSIFLLFPFQDCIIGSGISGSLCGKASRNGSSSLAGKAA